MDKTDVPLRRVAITRTMEMPSLNMATYGIQREDTIPTQQRDLVKICSLQCLSKTFSRHMEN